ncbi:MAG TPA: hypothetical protein VIZ31_06045, partial [Vicinamibacteria bacterium]
MRSTRDAGKARNERRGVGFAVTAMVLWLSPVLLGSTSAADTRAFVGARVIDGTGRPAIESAVLLVREGKVAALAPAAGFDLPPG